MSNRLKREAAPTVVFGSLESEYLAIHVFRRLYDVSDYWDGNWIDTEIRIRTRGITASYRADLRAEELERLRDGLVPMYETLSGGASLRSLEEWLSIDIEADRLGHCEVKYVAVVSHSPRTALESSLQLDQTYLPAVINQLNRILAAFPVIGARPDPSSDA